ncbi:MATE family efflux transporter [Phenylobacterium sp.]|jgi:MATE family multidrug resistance protein|uniref:MATE family efflux transporter n=1 Tax=Phenylobacterium sp. TaxID=1871053 RepID=UPI0037841C7A
MESSAARTSPEAGTRASPYREELPQLLKLSGPVVLSRLGIMTMGLTDAVVLGRYSAKELGFHALAWAPTSVALTTAIGLLVGVQVMTARAVGEGRRDRTGAVLRRGLSYGLLIGLASAVLLAALGPPFLHVIGLDPELADGASLPLLVFSLSLPLYALSVVGSFWLEGLARPGPAAVAMWVANIVNLALVLLLVPGHFGLPALGATGAAWATFGARTFLTLAIFAYIARMGEARSLGVFRKPERDRAAEAEQRRIGYGGGASNFFEVAAFASMNVIAGWIGGLAVAAWAIVLNVMAIVFMVPLGLASGAAVLVGRAYGARDAAGIVRAGVVAFIVTLAFALVVSLVIWPAAGLIVGGYTRETPLLAIAAPAMALAALMFVPDCLQVVVAQALRARGDVLVPTATHMVTYFGVMMPLGYWLAIPLGYGVNGLVGAIILASLISAGLLLARFWMLSRRGL